MIKVLVSDQAYQQLKIDLAALNPWVHGKDYVLLPLSQTTLGEDIDVAFISRDVTGKSTKSQTLASTQAFYDRLINSKRLKWVHIHSAGADRPIYKELMKRGAALTTSYGANALVVAQTALAAILTLNRNMLSLAASQRAHEWTPLVSSEIKTLDLEGQNALVVGRGPVGSAISHYLTMMGVHCEQIRFRQEAEAGVRASTQLSRGSSTTSKTISIIGEGVEASIESAANTGLVAARNFKSHHFTQISSVLPKFQWLILACPLTPQSKFLIDKEMLSRLPRGAHVINVARGEVVVEEDLIKALQEGHLGGAYLDVFNLEPLPKESPLWNMKNVIVTPHSAGHSEGNEGRVQVQFVKNLERFLSNEPLLHLAINEG